MTERIWTRTQYGKLSELQKKYRLPEEVITEIHRVVEILDTYYDPERDVDRDDGGYVLLFTDYVDKDRKIQKFLDKYDINLKDAELDDTLCIREGVIWMSTLYLVSNDYGINFIYPYK